MRDWKNLTDKDLSKTDIIALNIAQSIKEKGAILDNQKRCEVAMKAIVLVEYALNVDFMISGNTGKRPLGEYSSKCESGNSRCEDTAGERLIGVFEPRLEKPEEL